MQGYLSIPIFRPRRLLRQVITKQIRRADDFADGGRLDTLYTLLIRSQRNSTVFVGLPSDFLALRLMSDSELTIGEIVEM